MGPTERKRGRPAGALRIGEAAIGSIAVGLQHAGIALQQRHGVVATAPRRVAVHHRRRRPAAPGPIVAGQHPEVTLLGTPSTWIKYRGRRLVDEQLGRAQHLVAHQPPHWFDLDCGVAGPEGQRRPIDHNALPCQDLGLAVKRAVVGVFRDDDMGNQLLCRQAALDQPRRRRRLHDCPLAAAAGVFRPPRHDHLVLRRDDIEPLRAVFADHMHRAAAARAGGIFRFDDDLDPRQMLGQRAAPGPPLFRAGLAQRRIGLLVFGLALGNCLFEIFQGQIELVGIELFRTPAELHPLQLANQVAQSVVLTSELIALFDEPRLLGPLGVALGPDRQHEGAQRCDVVGKDLWAHDRDYRIVPIPYVSSTYG
jgi:hypothetical protein